MEAVLSWRIIRVAIVAEQLSGHYLTCFANDPTVKFVTHTVDGCSSVLYFCCDLMVGIRVEGIPD